MRLLSLVCLLVTVPAFAQPDPLVRPLPPAASGTEALGKFLRELGFEPKALSPDVYQITVERERWPVHIMTSLSTDGRRVWLESKFAPVEDPDKVPPATWKRLLEANEKIGPAHFAFDKGDNRVHLYKSFDNTGLSTDRLKREVEHFDLTVRKTQDYWRADNFKPAEVAAVPTPDKAIPLLPPSQVNELPVVPVAREIADSDRLMGEWSVIEVQSKGRRTPDDVLKSRRPSLVFRQARDRDIGPALKGKVMADLTTGPDRTRTVWVNLSGPSGYIDFVDETERTERGIYKLEAGTLTMCFSAPGELRPTEFKSDEGGRGWVIVLRKR
jgi:uncharacterized protein (TIGR03067 family)